AQVEHPADVVVVSGGAVEQLADERLPVGCDRVVRLQDRMRRGRFGHGRTVYFHRAQRSLDRAGGRPCSRSPSAPPSSPPPTSKRRRSAASSCSTCISRASRSTTER